MEKEFGHCVAVLDKGFVYAGTCSRDEELLYIKQAKNIIIWGTSEGLHELVIKGPLKETKLSPASDIKVPWHAVISLHPSDIKNWEPKKATKK